jgi:hypothetical protein
MASMMWFTAIVALIGTWFVGVASVTAIFSPAPARLALLVLPASVVAALLVAFFILRAHWRHDALATAGASPRSSDTEDGSDDLDDVLAQSFPASDPPSSSTGIARVLPAPAR